MSSKVGYNSSSANLTSRDIATAGAMSGFFTRMFVQPLDVVKIRFQLQIEPICRGGGGRYSGLLQAMRQLVKEEGATALWRGHVAAQLLTVVYGAGQFWSYNFLTKAFITKLGKGDKNVPDNEYIHKEYGCVSLPCKDIVSLSASQVSLCGGLAAALGTLVSMPCDVARTRLVAQSSLKYRGLGDVWRQMLVQEGAHSLWRGLLPTLAATVPYAAIQFPVYTALMTFTAPLDQEGMLWRSSVSGSVAGLIAKLSVYPLDVLKKRSQIRGAEHTRQHFGKVVVYRNTLDIVVRVTRDEGVSAWFKGLTPALVKSSLASAVAFTSYELLCGTMLSARELGPED